MTYTPTQPPCARLVIAISTHPTDLLAFTVGLLLVLGLLAFARWCPSPWANGHRGCDCPPERRRSRRRHRAHWPYTDYVPQHAAPNRCSDD